MRKFLILPVAALLGTMTFTACSSDNDKNEGGAKDEFNIVATSPVVDNDTYAENTTAAYYSNKSFGEGSIDGCANLVDELTAANALIASAKLSETQEAYLYQVLKNLVVDIHHLPLINCFLKPYGFIDCQRQRSSHIFSMPRLAFQPSSLSANDGSAQHSATSPGRRALIA